MSPDRDAVVRALRRLVYTHKLLTVEDAARYCDLHGIPRSVLSESPRDGTTGG